MLALPKPSWGWTEPGGNRPSHIGSTVASSTECVGDARFFNGAVASARGHDKGYGDEWSGDGPQRTGALDSSSGHLFFRLDLNVLGAKAQVQLDEDFDCGLKDPPRTSDNSTPLGKGGDISDVDRAACVSEQRSSHQQCVAT